MLRGPALGVAALLVFACGSEPSSEPSAEPLTSDAQTAATLPSATAAPSVDVVSHASETGNYEPVLVEGSIDGAALRKRNLDRFKSDLSPVIALTGDDPTKLGHDLCEQVVPKRSAATPVLLKPNIGGFDSLKDPKKSAGDNGVEGRITNPEFVRGVIRCLRERGHTNIIVADGWGGPHDYWKKLVDVSGYADLAREENVPLVCMCDDGVFNVEGTQPGKPVRVNGMGKTAVPTLLLPKVLAEHLNGGLFINIPKMKAHRFSVVSLGIKGLQGVVMLSSGSPAHRQKFHMHEELSEYLKQRKEGAEDRSFFVGALDKFAKRMVDVLEVAAPDVTLLEGTPMTQGDGFQLIVPLPKSLAIGGTNAVRVDQVGAQALGAWKNSKLALGLQGRDTSPLISKAAERFGVDFERTVVEGNGTALVKSPPAFVFRSMAPFELRAEAGAAGPAVSPATPAHAALLDGTIELDGSLTEPAWQRATPFEFATDWSGATTNTTTRVRLLWSKDAFYAGFELTNAGLFSDKTRPTDVERAKLYEEDCVELFLGRSLSEPQRYFEIEVGPFGHFLDLEIDRDKKLSNVDWSSEVKSASTHDAEKRTATIELRLDSSDLTSLFEPGRELPLAVYRMEGQSERQYLAWRPTLTKRPNFHVPERFGRLVLDP